MSRPRPWDGLVSAADLRALEQRGRPLDRDPAFPRRPALVLVDLTRSYVEPGYPLFCAGGPAALAAAADVLAAARRGGVPIVFTVQDPAPPPDGAGYAHLLGTPPGRPDAHGLADVLAPRPGERVLRKGRPSAFFDTPLRAHLDARGVDGLVVVGVVTSGCVRATVVDAYSCGYRTVVVEEAVADYSDFQHRAALLDLHAKYADLARLDDVVDAAFPEPYGVATVNS